MVILITLYEKPKLEYSPDEVPKVVVLVKFAVSIAPDKFALAAGFATAHGV